MIKDYDGICMIGFRESKKGKVMGQSTGSLRSIWNYLLPQSDCSGRFRSLVLLVAAITVLTLHAEAGGAFAAIGFVQGGYATPQSPQSVVSVTYTSAQVAGDLNVVVVGWNDTTAAVSSVTDSKGNVYTSAVGPSQASGLSQSIYYARGILAAGASTNTVTVRFTVAAQYA